MHLRRTTTALALAVAVALPVVAAPSASASVTGSVTFHCTTTLGWPASFATGGSCHGNVPSGGGSAVALTGIDEAGAPYAVTGPGNFRADFESYSAICVANEPPIVGFFTGEAHVFNVPAVHNGVVTTADVSFRFEWTVVGAAGAATVTDWFIDFANGGSAVGTTGAGPLVFAPILTAANTCPGPGGALRATFTGEIAAVM